MYLWITASCCGPEVGPSCCRAVDGPGVLTGRPAQLVHVHAHACVQLQYSYSYRGSIVIICRELKTCYLYSMVLVLVLVHYTRTN